MLNVNGPGRDDGPLGVRLTRLGRRIYGSSVDSPHRCRRDATTTGSTTRFRATISEDGTDLAAIDAGFVSVSPLRLRLDDAAAHAQLASWKLEELS